MTDRDRNELHKLLDRMLDEKQNEGTYQSIIANVVLPSVDVTYDRFYCKINLDIEKFRIG